MGRPIGSSLVTLAETRVAAGKSRSDMREIPNATSAPSTPTIPETADPIAIATGVLSISLGLIFLAGLGGYTGSLSTHFSQVVMGCSFVAMGLNWPVAARLLALPTGLLNLAVFIAYITLGPPGLDTVLIWRFWPEAPRHYSGDLNADLAYALTAIAIVLLTESGWEFRWRSITIVLAGSVVLGLSFVGLLGWYFTGQQTAYGLRRMMKVHLHTVVALGILGGGMLALAWRKGRQYRAERNAWIFVVVAVTGIVVSTSFWQAAILVEKLPVESTQQFRLYLGRMLLFSGLLAIALLGAAVYMVQTARLRTAVAERLRKQAQEEAAERQRYATELERTNRELQDFVYIASHDLQEPLRKIRIFVNQLRAHAGGGIDESHYLERIDSGASRMAALIEALLSYSRVMTQMQPFTRVALADVVALVLDKLSERIRTQKAHIEVSELPIVRGDALQIQRLFENLISNALTYRSRERTAHVEIGSRTLGDGSTEVFVVDNGIGFDEKYSDRIFRPFRRLHSSKEYEGAGMGLAICQRIVSRHGGSIRATSRLGQGSTFSFVLPAVAVADEQDAPTLDPRGQQLVHK